MIVAKHVNALLVKGNVLFEIIGFRTKRTKVSHAKIILPDSISSKRDAMFPNGILCSG